MTPPESAHFGDELQLLKDRVTAMGQVAEHRVRLALQGLLQRDRDALDDVIAGDDRLNQAQIEIDDNCFQLLALFQRLFPGPARSRRRRPSVAPARRQR